jgi:hypothetical protein
MPPESYILQGNKEHNHLQEPYIANQQDWREWGYLVAVVAVGQPVMRTAASSPATPAAPASAADVDAEPENFHIHVQKSSTSGILWIVCMCLFLIGSSSNVELN